MATGDQPPWPTNNTSAATTGGIPPAPSDTSEELLEHNPFIPGDGNTSATAATTSAAGPSTSHETQRETSQRRELARVGKISNFLNKPEPYTGVGVERFQEWTTWSRRMKNYLSTVNVHYERLMDFAEAATEPITSLRTTSTFPTLTIEDLESLSVDLRQVLTSYTTSNAAVRLASFSEQTSIGFELWRLMSHEYQLRTHDVSRKLLCDIMNFKFNTPSKPKK